MLALLAVKTAIAVTITDTKAGILFTIVITPRKINLLILFIYYFVNI